MSSSQEKQEGGRLDSTTEELKTLGALWSPIMLSYVLAMLSNLVDLAMIGHYGTLEMSAVALGMVGYAIAFDPLIGMCSALDTLFAQSFGAGKRALYGQWLLVGSIVLFLTSIFSVAIILSWQPFIEQLYPDLEVVDSSGLYIRLLLIGFLPQLAWAILTKFLVAQGFLWWIVAIYGGSQIFNIVIQYIFIFSFGWGVVGAAIATSLTKWFQFVCAVVYLAVVPECRERWPELNQETFSQLKWELFAQFLSLGMAGWAMEALQVWGFQITALFASFLGHKALDANNIILNLHMVFFIGFLTSVSAAVGLRVGQLLGAGDYDRAKLSSHIAAASVLVIMLVILVVLVLLRGLIGYAFSPDAEIAGIVADTIPFLSAGLLGFTLFSAVAGAFRGMGRQEIITILSLIGIWVIGIWPGTFFMFHWNHGGMGVPGLWLGISIGLLVVSVIGWLYLVFMVDWKLEADVAKERSKMGAGAGESSEGLLPKKATTQSMYV